MLLTGVHSLGFSNYQEYLNEWKSSLNLCKPSMHAFFELAFHKHTEERLWFDLNEWKKALQGAGWNTVVLTLDYAKRHPLYKTFRTVFVEAHHSTKPCDQMCFYRWLAMASTSDGGWMSDYDTYPLNMHQNYEHGFDLPNNGSFTSNLYFIPNLISGSKSEWNRMASLLLANHKRHTHGFWSNMLGLQDIIQIDPSTHK